MMWLLHCLLNNVNVYCATVSPTTAYTGTIEVLSPSRQFESTFEVRGIQTTDIMCHIMYAAYMRRHVCVKFAQAIVHDRVHSEIMYCIW